MNTLRRLAAVLVPTVRWLLLAAVLFLSLHHWTREGYWEPSGLRQFALPLLDPRVPAALLWWVLETALLVLVALPLADRLARWIPAAGPSRLLAISVLAGGLGTRGVVGALLMRAACASPAVFLPGGGEAVGSWLATPYGARWIVALTDLWWLLPGLAVLLRLLGPRWRTRRWSVYGLLAAWALLQPGDAAYLLTGGGPQGATLSLALLAVLEGFGRNEFGYASVLALALGAAALPVGTLACRLAETPETPVNPSASPPAWRWGVLAVLGLVPLLFGWLRNPPASLPSALLAVAGVSLVISTLGAAWTVLLAATLREPTRKGGFATFFRTGPLFLSSIVLVLPMIRPWGYRTGAVESLAVVVGMVALAPYLGAAWLTLRLVRHREAVGAAAALVAWATWTDLSLPGMLALRSHALLPLQGRIAWELSTQWWSSPLEVPGWPLAWLGGSVLAGIAVAMILRAEPAEVLESRRGPEA